MSSGAVASRLAAALVGGLIAVASPAAAFGGSASVAVAPSTPGAPSIGGFSARALGPKGELTPKTYFEQTLAPGESFDGTLLITNSAKTADRIRVYSVDGLTGATSGTVYANLGDPRNGASRWIRPKKKLLRLEPSSDRRLQFHVHVPDDATPGDHVGGIALQSADTTKGKGQFGVTEVIRVAVAIQIRVTGPAEAGLKVTGLGLKALGGTQIPSVQVDLQNTGQLLCRPALSVTLAQNGTTVGTVRRQLDTILPAAIVPYPLPWPKALAAGTYQATASTEGCGTPAQLAADVILKGTLTGTPQAPGVDQPTSDSGGGVPWWALVLTAIAALGGGFALARRRPKGPTAPSQAAVEPAPVPAPPVPTVPVVPPAPPAGPGPGAQA